MGVGALFAITHSADPTVVFGSELTDQQRPVIDTLGALNGLGLRG